MYKKGLKNFKRIKVIVALLLAGSLAFSGSYKSFSTPASVVYADGDTTEAAGTEGSGETKTEDEEDNILKAKTGRIAYWEWKQVTSVKDTFADNKYHPILFASCKTVPYSNYNHAFLSSYSDRDHVRLPTNTVEANNFKDEFPSVENNPEKEVGYYGHYGKYSYEAHSPSYYFNATRSVYYLNTQTGKNGISDSDFKSKRFFTYGDSMGVPWVRAAYWGPDGGRTMISICFPKKQLSNGECGVWQPDNKDFYLDVRGWGDDDIGKNREPTLCITHNQTRDDHIEDIWHLVYSYDAWYILSYNDNYRNEVCYDNFGANILNGHTDYSVLSLFAGSYYSIIPQGSKSPCLSREDTYCGWKIFEGFPHLMTSLESQTVTAPEVMPIDAGVFMGAGDDEDDNGTPELSDGIVLPKGQTLTIDGGTVYVATNFLNNGKIKIINGGTLIVKNGGCISPYTKNCAGEGTIECDGGNIIVMEGGKIYGFCTGVSKTSNPYNEKNAPIRIVGGGTMINYGTAVFTYGVIGKGSKIENRNKGVLKFGYNRIDQLEFMNRSPKNMGLSDPANYPEGKVTIGLFGIGSDKATVYNEKAATFEHKGKNSADVAPSDRVDIIVPNY